MSLYVDHLLKQQDAMTVMLRDMVEMETPSDDRGKMGTAPDFFQ